MIVLFNSFKPVVPSQPQYSGFNTGYLGYGDTNGSYTALVTYNRTISFSTDTESTRTAFSTARAPQGSSGFSPTSIYYVKGYNAGLVTTVDRVSPITDTSSTPTISFTTERRGPCVPLPNYNRNRIFFFGGYSDTLNIVQMQRISHKIQKRPRQVLLFLLLDMRELICILETIRIFSEGLIQQEQLPQQFINIL